MTKVIDKVCCTLTWQILLIYGLIQQETEEGRIVEVNVLHLLCQEEKGNFVIKISCSMISAINFSVVLNFAYRVVRIF